MPRGAEPLNRVEVLRGRVAFVRLPEIARIPGGETVHQRIPQHLGDHRRRRDRMAPGIAIHDRLVRAAELGTGQPVDEHMRRRKAQAPQRARHGENRRAPDVEPVDLPDARGADRQGEGALADLDRELLALRGAEHLRVIEPTDRLHTDRKDDGRGDHWTSQGTAADFIDTGDDAAAFAPQRRLAFQRRAAVSHVCGCSGSGVLGTVSPCPAPRFSRMRAALPASRRRKYSLARRTRPFRSNPISAIKGACSGKIRSTPTPAEILRTVKVSLMPPPRRAMQMPSNACRRSFSPSRTRTMTRSVSPGAKAGISVFRPSRSTALSFSIIYSPCFNQISGLRSRVRRSACAAAGSAAGCQPGGFAPGPQEPGWVVWVSGPRPPRRTARA